MPPSSNILNDLPTDLARRAREADVLSISAPARNVDPAVIVSINAAAPADKAKDARAKIESEGLTATVDKVTRRLRRSGLDDVSRLLLSNRDLYGHLLLEAFETDKIKADDEVGLYNAIVRRLNDEPRKDFAKELVTKIFQRNHINLKRSKPKLFNRVVEEVAARGIPLDQEQAEAAVLEIHKHVLDEGEIPDAVNAFAEQNEIPPENFTPEVQQAMVDYLVGLGIHPTAEIVRTTNEFDEYFAVAYDRATAVRDGRSDPIVLSRPQGAVTPWDFSVDTFDTADEQGVVKENILAAGALDYVYNLGELLGVYRLADALVLNWAAGAVDIVNTDVSQQLYRYWKVREDRMSPEERGMLYKRVLNKGDTEVLSKMVVNDAFPTLWQNLMQEVASYIEAQADSSKEPSRIPIQRAIQELQYNLTEFMTGMAHMQVTEMYAQLKDAMTLLGSNEIVSQLSGGRRKNVWAVIANVSKQELGTAPDVAAIRSLAVDGNRVFQTIARFTPGGFDEAEFQEFLDAAESWILAAASVGDYQPNGAGTQNDEQDEFTDDFADVGSDWDA